MKSLTIVSFFASFIFSLVFAEATCIAQLGSVIKLDPNKPIVYLAVKKKEKKLKISSNSRVWLSLHNNSRWKIWLAVSGGNTEIGKAVLHYDTLNSNNETIKQGGCHVCTLLSLDSGESLDFSIESEQYDRGLELRFPFWFDWESDADGGFQGSNEVLHFAPFSAPDSPN